MEVNCIIVLAETIDEIWHRCFPFFTKGYLRSLVDIQEAFIAVIPMDPLDREGAVILSKQGFYKLFPHIGVNDASHFVD